ncbi:hypothetical protein [Taklimakanibacter lacteus]|uniref:hypothetical protein n=1 Tax=Taklimakanibacter lacteus TaxID=2268456 RepID=UPI000E671526
MTTLLSTALAFLIAYAIYVAALSRHVEGRPEDFLDAGRSLPSWAYIFAGAGVVAASLGLHDHLLLTARYGLQSSHVAVGLIVVALASVLIQKRLWLAARITGSRTAGDLMGIYFDSIAIRLWLLGVLFLFSVPVIAYLLAETGGLMATASAEAMPARLVIWVAAFFLFLFSAVGGWRAVIYVTATLSLLLLILIAFTGTFAGVTFESLAFVARGIDVGDGILADQIPGVIQFSQGIGKGSAHGGIWTTIAILSFSLSMIGVVLSPGFGLLGITTSTRKAFAFNQVWVLGGLLAGLLLIVVPIIAAEMKSAAGADFAGIVSRLASLDQFAAIGFLLLVLSASLIGIAFFAASGASIVTIEVMKRFILPELTGRGQKLAARIALAVIYLAAATIASVTPQGAAIFSSLALSLSAQLLPAFLGLCWLPWISRSAVLTGLILGSIAVLFTEPLGLIFFEGLFVDLPWGRWPLTIHSAAWGLALNLGACFLVSIFTYGGAERDHRQRLHDVLSRDHRIDFGGPAARGAKWSLTLIWAFLALGPGAILGNDFFSQPMFTGGNVALGVPSLLVWQIIFWSLGVLIVWWFAYQSRMSVIVSEPRHSLTLEPALNRLERPATPPWIARLLGRVAGQSTQIVRRD